MNRISEYRIMWVLCFFDLPTETKIQRQRHSGFRICLLKDGFQRMQLSIYMRHCSSVEDSNKHILRIKNFMPPEGKIMILTITDKQFGKIQTFFGREERNPPKAPVQLELF